MPIKNRYIRAFSLIVVAGLIVGSLAACSTSENEKPLGETQISEAGDENGSQNNGDKEVAELDENFDESASGNQAIKAQFGDTEISITLDDARAAQEFAAMLPLTITLSDLNRNEKYAYLETPLSTEPYTPSAIEAGDLMLYGDNCLVLFYESFNSAYSYTRLGHVENISLLTSLADSDSVEITFDLA